MKLAPEQLAEIRKRHDSFDAMDDSIDLETMLAYLSLAHDHREILLDHIAALEADLKQSDFELNTMTTCTGELQDSYNALEEALKKLARLGNEPHLGNSEDNVIAQQALLKQEQE